MQSRHGALRLRKGLAYFPGFLIPGSGSSVPYAHMSASNHGPQNAELMMNYHVKGRTSGPFNFSLHTVRGKDPSVRDPKSLFGEQIKSAIR